jgi:uncharacterized coiled-coil protein SlyX
MPRLADTGACPLGMRHTHLSERFTRLSERLTRLSERFTRLSERFTRLSERLTRLSERLTRLSERFTRLSERFTRLSERFTRLSERFTHLSERFRQQGKSMAKVNKSNNLAIEISARLGIWLGGLKHPVREMLHSSLHPPPRTLSSTPVGAPTPCRPPNSHLSPFSVPKRTGLKNLLQLFPGSRYNNLANISWEGGGSGSPKIVL